MSKLAFVGSASGADEALMLLPLVGFSQSVFYTAKLGENVELFQITLYGQAEQLTLSAEATLHDHPKRIDWQR